MKIAAALAFLKKHLILIIVLSSVLVCGVAGTVIGVSIANSPKNITQSAIGEVFKSSLEREEVEYLSTVFNGGSIEFVIDSIENSKDYYCGKLYFNDKSFMLSDLKLNIDGTKIDGELYASEDTYYIYEKNHLDGAYGFKLSTLADELKYSVFYPGSNTAYSLNNEDFYELIDFIDCINENKKVKQDFEKLLEKVMKKLWKILNDYAEYEVEHDDARIDGEKVAVRTIIMRLSPDKTADALYDAYDYLCESDDIIKFIKKYDDYLRFMLGDDFDSEEYDSVADMYQTLIDDAEESLTKICNRLESLAEEYEDEDEDENPYDFKISITTPKSKSTLISFSLYTGFTPSIYLNTNCKNGIKETKDFSIKVGAYSVEYQELWNNDYYYQAKLILASSNKAVPLNYVIDIDIDKELGTYSIRLNTESTGSEQIFSGRGYFTVKYTQTEAITLSGTYSQKKDELTVSFDKLEATAKRVYADYRVNDVSQTNEVDIDGKLIFKKNDKMPSPMTDFEKISEITEDQLDNLLKPLKQ